ncbi:hypothetical protein L7F22_058504 [Adiantum nelumboides]|nr:hypothetical protein [Adiantum nelumboides]
MQEVVGLMKNLSVHMMGGGRGQGYGYGRGYGSNDCFASGKGRGMAGRGDMFQCYNCGQWGHKSPQCDKPKRMGGDMFPLPSQISSRAQDCGIEIKGEAGPSRLTAEEKGKTKLVNIIRLDKGKDDINAMVMPVGKRTTREQETSDAGPSHKRGKQAETGTGKEKKKRKPRRHYNTSDFPLGEGQPNYNLRADLVGRKADVTFRQLMEMCPLLKRQWKGMVNPMKNEPTKGSVRVLSLNEPPDICSTIDAWHKWKCIGEAYIDGAAYLPAFKRTFQKLSDGNAFPANPKVVFGHSTELCCKSVLSVDPQLCVSGGGNDTGNGSGSNGQGGRYNNDNSGDDHSGHDHSCLFLLGMLALFQSIDEGKLTHSHAGESEGTAWQNENAHGVRGEETQKLQTSSSNSDCGLKKQSPNDSPVQHAFPSLNDVVTTQALGLHEVAFDVSGTMAFVNECCHALKAFEKLFVESLHQKMAHIGWNYLTGNQEMTIGPLVHVDVGHRDTTISGQDDCFPVEGGDSNRTLNINGSSDLEFEAEEMSLHASGKQSPLEEPNSIQSNVLEEINLSFMTASDHLLQGVMRWFEQLGRPPKKVANLEFTPMVEQVEQQESRILSSEGATTALTTDPETGGKPVGAKQSDIDTLKRLQREAFFELMKLREKFEKLEQVTQARLKQEQLGGARTHLKGQVKAGTAFVVIENESIRCSRDSLELAGMQTGLDVKFTFETPFRENDMLITQIVSGQSSSVGDQSTLGGPLNFGKLHYVAHVSEDISLSIVPLGAQGQDVTEIVNVLQDQGLTSFSSQGSALFNHCKGSALGATVSGSKFAFSFAQYLSGWSNHVPAMEFLTEGDPLCYSTLCEILFQPTEGFILSFCGLNQYWPAPPLPSSMALHWSEMGPLIFPKIKAKKDNFSTTLSSGSDITRLHPHWEAPDLESDPATFQNKGTGLLSLAVSSSLDLGETLSLSGWAQVERGLLQDPDKGNFQWAMCLAKTSGASIDWGASIGGSQRNIWHVPSSSYDDYLGDDVVNLHGPQLNVEAFLKLSCGKGFTLQPGLLYVSNKSSHTPAIVVRSSWSL